MSTLRSFGFLADENVHTEVVQWMRSQGLNVLDVREQGWQGASDNLLLDASHGMGRVVLTHDADFGRLTIAVIAGMNSCISPSTALLDVVPPRAPCALSAFQTVPL